LWRRLCASLKKRRKEERASSSNMRFQLGKNTHKVPCELATDDKNTASSRKYVLFPYRCKASRPMSERSRLVKNESCTPTSAYITCNRMCSSTSMQATVPVQHISNGSHEKYYYSTGSTGRVTTRILAQVSGGAPKGCPFWPSTTPSATPLAHPPTRLQN